MSDEAVYRTAPATPGLLITDKAPRTSHQNFAWELTLKTKITGKKY